MSQPNKRSCTAPIPGELNSDLGEFWVDDPWQINQSHNLSSFEKNQFFLNSQGKDFLNLSHISGTDSDGDARCAVAADFLNSGKLDLIVRQVGGGGLLLYQNEFADGNFIKIHLRGNPSNSLGIGAKVKATLEDGKTYHQSLFPVNSFRSQSPNVIHLGLGEAESVEKLQVTWPSGKEITFSNIQSNQTLLIKEWEEQPKVISENSSIQ